jgi:hypothetical protein
MAENASLVTLPTELLWEIQSYLRYASAVALQLTCLELYRRLDDPNRSRTTRSRPYDMTDLLEIELWPAYHQAPDTDASLKQAVDGRDYFACHICLQIRSARHFSNAMMKGKRGKLGLGTLAEKAARFCIECGIANGRYPRGALMMFGGATMAQGAGGGYGFVCLLCRQFQPERGARASDFMHHSQIGHRKCNRCLEELHNI